MRVPSPKILRRAEDDDRPRLLIAVEHALLHRAGPARRRARCRHVLQQRALLLERAASEIVRFGRLSSSRNSSPLAKLVTPKR